MTGGGDHPRRGWWRRNRTALIAVLILVPLSGAILVGNGFRRSRSDTPSDAIHVDVDQTAVYAGVTIGPVSADFSSEASPAPDSRVLLVVVPISGENPLDCSITLRESTGAEREWSEASGYLSDVDWSAPRTCDAASTGPYSIEMYFLVPDDATGPFTLDLVEYGQIPRFLRLELHP